MKLIIINLAFFLAGIVLAYIVLWPDVFRTRELTDEEKELLQQITERR